VPILRALIRQYAFMATPGGESPAGLKGCLGTAVGEGVAILALALLAGLLLLLARGLDALLQRSVAAATVVATAAVAAFVYGLVWTVRVKPGLYLEHLKTDPERRAKLGTEHIGIRKAGMIYLQIMCLMPFGYAMTLLIWSRP
jgi:hypothetical protein